MMNNLKKLIGNEYETMSDFGDDIICSCETENEVIIGDEHTDGNGYFWVEVYENIADAPSYTVAYKKSYDEDGNLVFVTVVE